ncbi:MAG: CotH kinase family protein [Bacteroidaceae bacterium]|nr:CotH kinase family protein [Bacteroidaceae bacterium]
MKRGLLLRLLICLLSLAHGQNTKAQIVINEIMQSNIDCIMDDMNDFPDSWVEIFNPTGEKINLGNYKIGLTENGNEAWTLPNTNIEPKGYYLLYCDKETTGRHTNFRLESGKGGSIFLFKGENAIIDKIEGLPKQPAPNIAYGRKHDGTDELGYQYSPTPEKSNCGTICEGILSEPIFSKAGNVTTLGKTFNLTLSLPDDAPEGCVIRYTTDGSEPTEESNVYTSQIPITKTTIIRAKPFCKGWLSPRSTTHSYIFFPRELTLPIISIVSDDKYFYDNQIGILVQGTYNAEQKNYNYNWRRPINLEFFNKKLSTINQLCETRVFGAASRDHSLKSLALYAHKRFGQKRFKQEFFPDQRPGIDEFKSIALRNAGNDFDYLYMRDAVIQRTMATHADLDWQAWAPAIVYINGEYKGMLNIRERSNEDNIYTHYNELEDIDLIENWWELKEGTMDNFQAFQAFYTEKGHTLAEYEKWMDCTEFANLMIMNIYYNNQDFPGNNITMWRPREEGGRWRFIAKDTDFGLGLYGSPASYNTILWLHTPGYDMDRNWANSSDATRLFRRLMDDKDFKRDFIDRTLIYMGDFMNYETTWAILQSMYEQIKYEYPNHRKLINEWWPNYNDELSQTENWLKERHTHFYQHLADYYELGTPINMVINEYYTEEQLKKTQVEFNGITLSKGKFDGKFFAGRDITLKAEPNNETTSIKGWEITITTSSGGSKEVIYSDEYTFSMPTCSKLRINLLTEAISSIEEMDTPHWTWRIDGEDLIIDGVQYGETIRLYNAQGMLVSHARSMGETIRLKRSVAPIHILIVGESASMKIATP